MPSDSVTFRQLPPSEGYSKVKGEHGSSYSELLACGVRRMRKGGIRRGTNFA